MSRGLVSSANSARNLVELTNALVMKRDVKHLTFSKDTYLLACKNKIPLTYLESLDHQEKGSLEVYHYHRQRYQRTLEIIDEVSELLEEKDVDYVVFKTLGPYPEDVADVDVLILNAGHYLDAIRAIKDDTKMEFIDKGPHCITFRDSKPMHLSKDACYEFRGPYGCGRLMLDIYNEIAANRLIYVNKHNLRSLTKVIKLPSGCEARVFKPEADILIRIGHSAIKEQSYNLADYLVLLYQLINADENFFTNLVSLARRNKLMTALKWYLNLTLLTYRIAEGRLTARLRDVTSIFRDTWNLPQGVSKASAPPYRCDTKTFMSIFREKLQDKVFRKSLVDQLAGFMDRDFMLKLLARSRHL